MLPNEISKELSIHLFIGLVENHTFSMSYCHHYVRRFPPAKSLEPLLVICKPSLFWRQTLDFGVIAALMGFILYTKDTPSK